ncbi:hypothetical protein GGI20_006154, partial [Coemansia sp. BCRC 34301]
QVEEAIVGHTPSIESASSNEPSRDELGISEDQRMRARWRRNKLVTMLGDVPSGVTTVYRTDPVAQQKSDDDDNDSSALCASQSAHMKHRQRARKLRHFFGQSLAPDAILRQSSSPRLAGIPESLAPDIVGEEESYEFVPLKSGPPPASSCWDHVDSLAAALPDLEPPNRAQFWMTTSSASSPESQASVVASEKTNRRASLIASLRARKASIIGTIKRATPSTSSLLPPQTPPHTAAAKPQGGIKMLSPLPPISPNNFQASFDRGMALREVVAVAEYIAGSPYPPPPPRVSSAAERSDHHRRVISSALLAPNRHDARSRPALDGPRATHPKTVHWFDGPQTSSTRRRSPTNAPPTLPVSFVPPQCPPPPPNSAKTSLDLSMSIVLRSPSSTKPAVTSPRPPTVQLPSPPPVQPLPPPPPPPLPLPPPRMALTHKASITAVGGPNRSQPAVQCYNNIVTIRPRRSQSFAISRKLERATAGRKRSHTIGSGRQAAARLDVQTKDDDAIPRADKPSRRVQSMIVATQTLGDGKQQ